jgi:alpha-galactosidase
MTWPLLRVVTATALATVLLPAGSPAQTFVQADPSTTRRVGDYEMSVLGDLKGFSLAFRITPVEKGLDVVTLDLKSPTSQAPPRFTIKWSMPSHDIVGQWTTGRHLTKTLRPDWAGSRLQASMFAREAPVSCLFSSDNTNVFTFAVSDALNTVLTASGVREEDGLIYNEAVFFSERHVNLTSYTAELRLDRRPVRYERALAEVSAWWANKAGYAPAAVPELARLPMYSTWYNYHQNVSSPVLLKEIALAKEMGFESIIVDDGWQTLDSARGYAYTGDWEPERMPDMKVFVQASHEKGVKVLLWYAVPFVGKNAKVAAQFKDKSLRYEERLGAYVLDPRYPEVRDYLISVYRKALVEWGIDGFKLDFIERFVADQNTVLEAKDGRDYASVNEATDRMMTDILAELRRLKPDVMIEFRQPYIGPLIRKYGNIFRASDSPNSYLANRVKTVDLRLLSGQTAVHADMIMWHSTEPVEKAAFQLLNVLFSVPQVSVRLGEIPKDHAAMIRFYIDYWRRNRAVLLDGALVASAPGANYPLLSGYGSDKQITALFTDQVVTLDGSRPGAKIDIVNAKASRKVVLVAGADLGRYRYTVRDCQGRETGAATVQLTAGLHAFDVPVSGLLALERIP